MTNNTPLIGIGVITLICVLSFAPAQVSGVLVWSETFDEIDPAL